MSRMIGVVTVVAWTAALVTGCSSYNSGKSTSYYWGGQPKESTAQAAPAEKNQYASGEAKTEHQRSQWTGGSASDNQWNSGIKGWFSSKTYDTNVLAACHDLNDCKLPESRANAARVLGEMGASADTNVAIEALEKGTKDRSEDVRTASADALRKIGSPNALHHLQEAQEKGRVSNVQTTQPSYFSSAEFNDVLKVQNDTGYGSKRSMWSSGKPSGNRSEWTGGSANDNQWNSGAKGWFDSRSYDGHVLSACHDLNDGKLAQTRFIAARELGNMGSNADVNIAIERLEKGCKDGNQDVRMASAEALQKIGSTNALHHLKEAQDKGYVPATLTPTQMQSEQKPTTQPTNQSYFQGQPSNNNNSDLDSNNSTEKNIK